jgi:hypothetical protein
VVPATGCQCLCVRVSRREERAAGTRREAETRARFKTLDILMVSLYYDYDPGSASFPLAFKRQKHRSPAGHRSPRQRSLHLHVGRKFLAQLALGAKKGSNSQVAVCQAQLDACVVRRIFCFLAPFESKIYVWTPRNFICTFGPEARRHMAVPRGT